MSLYWFYWTFLKVLCGGSAGDLDWVLKPPFLVKLLSSVSEAMDSTDLRHANVADS